MARNPRVTIGDINEAGGNPMRRPVPKAAQRPMPQRKTLPPGVTIGDVNEAGGNPTQRMPRNPRMDSADVPRRKASDKGDVIININERKMAHGGYVCPPNKRTGNIDMRKTGMTRNVTDNRRKG